MLLGSFPPALVLRCLYLILFGLKSRKENKEVEAINHLESLVKAGAMATSGKETHGRAVLAGAGQRPSQRAPGRRGHGAGGWGTDLDRRLIFSFNTSN